MNETKRTFLLLTRALRVDTGAAEDAMSAAEFMADGVDWPRLFRLADRELGAGEV